MSKKTKLMIAAAAVIAVIAAAVLLLRNGSGGGNAVYVQRVSSMNGGIAAADRYSGVVESQESISVKKDPSRNVQEIYVQTSQAVEKGTPLFRYDVSDAENNMASTALQIEGNNISINQLNEDNKELKKERDAAPSESKLEYTRSIQSNEMQIKTLQLENKSLEGNMNKYRQEVSNAVVYAEAGGIIRAVNENGGYDSFGNELPFISIMETNDFRIRGKVSEQTIGAISVGMNVVIRSRVDENQTWSGTVARIETEPASDSGQQNYIDGQTESASSYPFFVSLASKEGLMLGQHVYIEPDYGQAAGQPDGLWLDASFIAEDEEGGQYVWVGENGKLRKRTVTTGTLDEETYRYEIISGLKNEDLIAWPEDGLQEGMKVTENIEEAAGGM